jgi:hypothetical protein
MYSPSNSTSTLLTHIHTLFVNHELQFSTMFSMNKLINKWRKNGKKRKWRSDKKTMKCKSNKKPTTKAENESQDSQALIKLDNKISISTHSSMLEIFPGKCHSSPLWHFPCWHVCHRCDYVCMYGVVKYIILCKKQCFFNLYVHIRKRFFLSTSSVQ